MPRTDNLLSIGLGERDRLNKELGGGIPRGSIVLMEGDYGAGKSAISQRFAYGLVEEGASVTMMSTELTVRGFIDQMHSLEYDMVKPLLNEELLFLHADFDSGGAFSDGDGERKELLKRLMNAEAMWNSDVVFLDTFDAIFRNDPTFEALVRKNEERQAALEIISFFRDIISQGKVVVLTVDPSAVDDDAIGPFRSIADVFLQLEMIEVGNDIRRQINVKRFAGMGEQVGDTIGFSVRSGTGIVIESRSVA
ncbi:ATPase domain-containing protein [Halorubrum depositum]|uniref:ATPase domain-containing protein n=1 Tax=Halorubrum depositum TaxID=2583992 RepID=UPI0011A86CCD|nr:ATPase domain-containing protein [Halorubrum depositum]